MDKLFKRELAENEAWFNGSTTVLEHFFKLEYPKFKVFNNFEHNAARNFWHSVSGDIPRVHSGVPSLISRTWTRLINPRDVEITLGNDTDDEVLNDIFKATKFKTKVLPKLIATMSWAGFAFLKLSVEDNEILIEVVNPKYADVKTHRDKIVSYTFIRMEEDYRILEHYELDGTFKVSYEAQELLQDEWVERDLPEGYEDMAIAIPFIPAMLFNNTPYNSRFPDSIYGESDYSNIHSQLHSLDNVLSNIELDVEEAKHRLFINEDLMKTGINGKEYYDKNETRVFLSSAQMQEVGFDLKKLIVSMQPNVRVTEFNATAKEITGRILALQGLNASTVGLPGFDSIDSAANSQRERKETSIVSRNERANALAEYLQEFIPYVMNLHNVIKGKGVKKYDTSVVFDKYGAATWEDLIEIIVKAVQGGVMSIKEAVDIIFDGRTEAEKAKIVLDIKTEGSITFTQDDLDNDLEDE